MHLTGAAALVAALIPGPAAPAADPWLWRYDFVAADVVIWSEPRAGSDRRGVGRPGEQFASDRSERHELFQCGRFEARLWHHGRNLATGVSGWVPACYLDDPD